MPWSPLWRGQDEILRPFLASLDGETRQTVQDDLRKIEECPEDPDLPWWDWMGDDYLGFWPSRVAFVAGRFLVRYIAWSSPPYYAVVSIVERRGGHRWE